MRTELQQLNSTRLYLLVNISKLKKIVDNMRLSEEAETAFQEFVNAAYSDCNIIQNQCERIKTSQQYKTAKLIRAKQKVKDYGIANSGKNTVVINEGIFCQKCMDRGFYGQELNHICSCPSGKREIKKQHDVLITSRPDRTFIPKMHSNCMYVGHDTICYTCGREVK